MAAAIWRPCVPVFVLEARARAAPAARPVSRNMKGVPAQMGMLLPASVGQRSLLSALAETAAEMPCWWAARRWAQVRALRKLPAAAADARWAARFVASSFPFSSRAASASCRRSVRLALPAPHAGYPQPELGGEGQGLVGGGGERERSRTGGAALMAPMEAAALTTASATAAAASPTLRSPASPRSPPPSPSEASLSPSSSSDSRTSSVSPPSPSRPRPPSPIPSPSSAPESSEAQMRSSFDMQSLRATSRPPKEFSSSSSEL